MGIDRNELHALLDKVPEADLPVTRKLLQVLATEWDVDRAEAEGRFTDEARQDIEAAETYFDKGGKGISHRQILEEFDQT